MSEIFVTSDTHFNHGRIIEYCDRPFVTVEEMNEALVENWNRVVGKDDVVYHCGDFAMGGAAEIGSFVKRLNGRIKLIKGNHDRYGSSRLRDCGFAEVYDRPIIIQDYLILSHAPMDTMVGRELPFFNIYGHVHDDSRYATMAFSGACVCVERWNYAPVSLEDLKFIWEREFGEL